MTHQLLKTLETSVADGRKLLVPYLMAGLPDRESYPLAYAATQRYADVVEVGLPYSDPLMDGPVIAAAGSAPSVPVSARSTRSRCRGLSTGPCRAST